MVIGKSVGASTSATDRAHGLDQGGWSSAWPGEKQNAVVDLDRHATAGFDDAHLALFDERRHHLKNILGDVAHRVALLLLGRIRRRLHYTARFLRQGNRRVDGTTGCGAGVANHLYVAEGARPSIR
jgi:hypothetical protein